MALIPCSECKKEISDKASACPHCGAPVVLVAPVVHKRVRGSPFVVDERVAARTEPVRIDPKTALIFRHPKTQQVTDLTNIPLWALLFGAIYFAVKGIWTHAVAGILLAIVTAGISWLVYPLFARQIMRNHLLLTGWEAVGK